LILVSMDILLFSLYWRVELYFMCKFSKVSYLIYRMNLPLKGSNILKMYVLKFSVGYYFLVLPSFLFFC
jgi:hypothetical protein